MKISWLDQGDVGDGVARERLRMGFGVILLMAMAVFGAGLTHATARNPDHSRVALLDQYAALSKQLEHNQFQRPLHLQSIEQDNDLQGDIHALVDYPFATVSTALNKAEHWCDVLILHINIKYCQATRSATGTVLKVSIGRRFAQPVEEAYAINFNYRVLAATPKYLEIELLAAEGPLGTRDYRIQLQAVAVGDTRTFLHFTYAYAYGFAGRLAMKSYLATLGSGKVGFTVTGKKANGKMAYIDGVRGVVERNVMRYYLAIDAYLGAVRAKPGLRQDQRLQGWYSATEQYPRQLHEVERSAYLSMKRSEILRQQDGR